MKKKQQKTLFWEVLLQSKKQIIIIKVPTKYLSGNSTGKKLPTDTPPKKTLFRF